MSYCIYLRKSRADLEAEAHGEGETLTRHEVCLRTLAKRLSLDVGAVYREVVSGETIAARPVMQSLLRDVEQNCWSGVLVMEVERLARGDTVDQGIVARTFRYTGTKIVTPLKTYDPDNEFDEEYFEFGLFMSRREYQAINRRLQRGRAASVAEGKFVGSIAPYGYRRIKLMGEKGYTLAPVAEEAETVKLIFSLFVNEQLTGDKIAERLNRLGIHARKGAWSAPSIRGMLQNPVYIGQIRWNWRRTVRQMEDGTVKKSRPRSDNYSLTDGRHPPILDPALWQAAQKKFTRRPPVHKDRCLKNPLAGLIRCGRCGKNMIRRHDRSGDALACPTPGCPTVSAPLTMVEETIFAFLDTWYGQKMISSATIEMDDTERSLKETYQKQLDRLLLQQKRQYDLLEQDVYTPDTFASRAEDLARRIRHFEEQLKNLDTPDRLPPNTPVHITVPELYRRADTAQKNRLLHTLIDKIEYIKDHGGRWTGAPNEFALDFYPLLGQDE